MAGKKRIAVPTLHKKLQFIAPAFEGITAIELIEVAIDTDCFGTFTGEVERKHSPLETAKMKAESALQLGGFDAAIASEGSIGPDLMIPFLNSDTETLIYLEPDAGIEIYESYRSFEIVAKRIELEGVVDLKAFLLEADFPHHRLIVRTLADSGVFAIKGIAEEGELKEALARCLDLSVNGKVTVENDFRAHMSPSRQKNIEEVARRLAKRLSTVCPKCRKPGFGQKSWSRGVNCAQCGILNPDAIHLEILGCPSCSYSELGTIVNEVLEARNCQYCNP